MKYPAKPGLPTAIKARGAEWYYPAVTCEYGRPAKLIDGQMHATRGKAKAEAARLLKSASEKEGGE